MGNFSGSNYSEYNVNDDKDLKIDGDNVITEGFWEGPFGVLVSNVISSVIAQDGYNAHYRDGGVTEMGMLDAPEMNETIYKEKYATLGNDGKYYHNDNKKNLKIDGGSNNNTITEGFWKGPFGVLVSNVISSVVAEDGYNDHDQDGEVTEMFMEDAPEMNETIYKEKYATLGNDGKYYHNDNDKNNYWTGPYGVLVPNDVFDVVARDGYNSRHKDGGVTERFMKNAIKMTEEIYKERYATLKNGKYYYKTNKTINIKNNDNVVITKDAVIVTLAKPNIEKDGYWIGPYGVLVSNDVNIVVAKDGYNSQHKNGGETERGMINPDPMNETIYREKYAIFKNGKYYYDADKQYNNAQEVGHWVGPYGILVSKHIDRVLADDGYNTQYQSGGVTEMFMELSTPMTEEKYKQKFATLKDGKYYYDKDKANIDYSESKKQYATCTFSDDH